jgi:phage terminase large subunit
MLDSSPQIEFPEYYRDYFQPRRYKGLRGGRGSGKSHCDAGHLILRAASEDDFRAVCIREVQRSIADSVKQLLEDKITAYGLGGFFKITEAEISGANGSRIIFKGMQNHTAASIKSLEGFDVAWVEEAQTLSAKSLELLTPTMRKPGAEIWFTWNPENEDDPVDVFMRQEGKDFLCKTVNWDDNPWFPEALRSEMERDRERDPDKYEHVWNGAYRGLSEARIFRSFRSGRLDVPDNVVWFYGADWGFSNDPAAAVRFCFPDPKTLYIRNEVYELGLPMESHPTFLAGLPGSRDWPMRADNARPEIIDYCRRHGFPKIRAAKKGKGSVEDGISFVQSFDVVIHPSCANTLREFQRYAYKTDQRTGEILPVVEDKNNHAIDALRYGCEGLHRKGKLIVPLAVEAAKKPEGFDYGLYDDDEVDGWKVV